MPYLSKPKNQNPFRNPQKKRNVTDRKKERAEIYNSKEWKKLRKAYYMAHPLCEHCLANDIVRPAVHVHHKDSFMKYDNYNTRMAVALDWNNLVSLCLECHEKEHNNVKKKWWE